MHAPTQPPIPASYERLESLGDAFLKLACSVLVMVAMPGRHEGHFTRLKDLLVNNVILEQAAVELELDQYLQTTPLMVSKKKALWAAPGCRPWGSAPARTSGQAQREDAVRVVAKTDGAERANAGDGQLRNGREAGADSLVTANGDCLGGGPSLANTNKPRPSGGKTPVRDEPGKPAGPLPAGHAQAPTDIPVPPDPQHPTGGRKRRQKKAALGSATAGPQRIPLVLKRKELADMMEALVGAFVMAGGNEGGLVALRALGILPANLFAAARNCLQSDAFLTSGAAAALRAGGSTEGNTPASNADAAGAPTETTAAAVTATVNTAAPKETSGSIRATVPDLMATDDPPYGATARAAAMQMVTASTTSRTSTSTTTATTATTTATQQQQQEHTTMSSAEEPFGDVAMSCHEAAPGAAAASVAAAAPGAAGGRDVQTESGPGLDVALDVVAGGGAEGGAGPMPGSATLPPAIITPKWARTLDARITRAFTSLSRGKYGEMMGDFGTEEGGAADEVDGCQRAGDGLGFHALLRGLSLYRSSGGADAMASAPLPAPVTPAPAPAQAPAVLAPLPAAVMPTPTAAALSLPAAPAAPAPAVVAGADERLPSPAPDGVRVPHALGAAVGVVACDRVETAGEETAGMDVPCVGTASKQTTEKKATGTDATAAAAGGDQPIAGADGSNSAGGGADAAHSGPGGSAGAGGGPATPALPPLFSPVLSRMMGASAHTDTRVIIGLRGDELEREVVGRTFRQRSLLMRAVTHSSDRHAPNYQILEFLGDAVIGFLTVRHIFVSYPRAPPRLIHELTKLTVCNLVLSVRCLARGVSCYISHHSQALLRHVTEFRTDLEEFCRGAGGGGRAGGGGAGGARAVEAGTRGSGAEGGGDGDGCGQGNGEEVEPSAASPQQPPRHLHGTRRGKKRGQEHLVASDGGKGAASGAAGAGEEGMGGQGFLGEAAGVGETAPEGAAGAGEGGASGACDAAMLDQGKGPCGSLKARAGAETADAGGPVAMLHPPPGSSGTTGLLSDVTMCEVGGEGAENGSRGEPLRPKAKRVRFSDDEAMGVTGQKMGASERRADASTGAVDRVGVGDAAGDGGAEVTSCGAMDEGAGARAMSIVRPHRDGDEGGPSADAFGTSMLLPGQGDAGSAVEVGTSPACGGHGSEWGGASGPTCMEVGPAVCCGPSPNAESALGPRTSEDSDVALASKPLAEEKKDEGPGNRPAEALSEQTGEANAVAATDGQPKRKKKKAGKKRKDPKEAAPPDEFKQRRMKGVPSQEIRDKALSSASTGLDPPKVLGDVMESILGAVVLDCAATDDDPLGEAWRIMQALAPVAQPSIRLLSPQELLGGMLRGVH
eukprot:jgi/Mesvir1/24065/Mv10790-RA.1